MDWQLEERWVWAKAYFHITNILLSESCVCLSLLKFLSTDPFAAVNDGWSDAPVFYEILGTIIITAWLIIVIVHASMNTLIHLITVYHFYREVSNQFITREI